MGDAIQAACSLKQELKLSLSLDLAGELTDEYDEPVSSEQAILYNAVSILRAEISQIEPSDHYPTPCEVSLQRSAAFVHQIPQAFIIWLINTEAYDSTSTDCPTAQVIRRRCLSIAERIVFNCSKVTIPLYMDLAVQLHNEFWIFTLYTFMVFSGAMTT